VKTRFQHLHACKLNLRRYAEVEERVKRAHAAGLCTLNQVDP
jgi:hypothetical protein